MVEHSPKILASKGWDVAQLVRASDRHAADAGSIPRCGKEFFSQSTFSADSLTCVRTPTCAITCTNICAHIKDPVVRVRVQWIMETLKHPACTVRKSSMHGKLGSTTVTTGFPQGKPLEFPIGGIPIGQHSCKM